MLNMTGEHKIRFLSLEDVLKCDGHNILKASEDILKGFHLLVENKLLQPHKTTLKPSHKQSNGNEGLVNFLPAYIDFGNEEVYGVKALGAMPSNVDIGMPRATGVIVLMDGATKSPKCIMDGQIINATRTAAVSYLAANKLADLSTEEIGLVGAGVNMRTQLMAMKMALPKLKRAYVNSRGVSKHVFAKEMSEKTNIEIIAVETAKEAVLDRMLVITCLPNVVNPVVEDAWIRQKGITHINIGCYECEASLLSRMDRVIADLWSQGKHRGIQTHAQAVKLGIIAEEKIEDLAPILTGTVSGRTHPEENIFFAPTGLGFEDVMVASRVFKTAAEKQIGTELPLWSSSKWI